ncbi:MAG: helix-turn-helix domain-containing protein [Dysgonomonas sp.]
MQTGINIPEIKDFFHINTGIDDFLYYRYLSKDLSITSDIPVRINGFAAGICMKGWIDISIGLNRFKINPKEFIIILPCYIVQVHETSEELDFQFVLVSDDFMNRININAEKLINPYFYIEKRPIVPIENDESRELILTMYDSIYRLCKFYAIPNYREMIQHYIYAFLFGVGHLFEELAPKEDLETKPSLVLLKRFFSLLQMHFKKHHSVNYYADELCLTPKYLSRYIKQVTGKTASEWIHDIIILEAKVLLTRNELSIQEVSHTLNFSDQTSFGKFFKRHTGSTPKNYKRQYST